MSDYEEASRAQWSSVAQGWAAEAERREAGPVGRAADWMLAAAGLDSGERVLELACGAGDVGLRAADAVGPAGRVLCTDFVEPMVELVRERAAAEGLEHVEARVMDALDPDVGEESYDVILCRLGFMLMPDPARAVRAARDLLAPAGRLVLAVWGPPEANAWLMSLFEAVMTTLGASPPEPGAPGPFSLAEHDRLRALLADAGFEDILIEDVEGERTFDSAEAWWDEMTTGEGPMASMMAHFDEDLRGTIRRRALENARAHAHEGGVRFGVRLTCARAT